MATHECKHEELVADFKEDIYGKGGIKDSVRIIMMQNRWILAILCAIGLAALSIIKDKISESWSDKEHNRVASLNDMVTQTK